MKKPSTLQELVNTPEQVKAFGKTYNIGKFTFGPMTQALEYVGVIGYVLQMLQELPKDKDGRIVAGGDQMIGLATRAVSVMGPSIFGIVSIATKEPVEWLEQQDGMDGVRIFAKVVEKNLDFFSQKNVDEITEMFGRLPQQVLNLGGDTAMTSSGTDMAPSET